MMKMATSVFREFSSTVTNDDGTTQDMRIRYIETDLANVSVKNIGDSATVKSSGEYGTNGVFFDTSTGNLVSIAINGGQIVRTGGSENAYKRGTMYHLTNGTIDAMPVKHYSEITSLSNIKWAVGGVSLFLERSYTNSSELYNDLSGENLDGFSGKAARPRTALGYKSGKILLVTAFVDGNDSNNKNGVDMWGLRNIMKGLNCTKAINLDGGGSTAIAYMKPNDTTRYVNNVELRAVKTMIRVPGTSFSDAI
jgi:exopolysaccharide biosynthesis protein